MLDRLGDALRFSAIALILLAGVRPAAGGHELPFYPGYYPQEIRVDALSPAAAAPLLLKGELHAYVGGDPLAGRADPADVRSVESLGGYVAITFNPAAPGLATRARRCDAAARIARSLRSDVPGVRAFPYPVTPYHSDYLAHFDLVQARRDALASGHPGGIDGLALRTKGPLSAKLLGAAAKGTPARWDALVEDVALDDLIGPERVAADGWLGPPWLKAGWFHAYLLQAPAVADRASGQAIDGIYQRLVTGAYADPAEAANLERGLVTQLGAGCERVVLGYALRRERFNAEFSQGIENVAWDSQAGFDSAIFVRTVKLKDFPWNGWLRLGIASRPAAAWNPIAGFTDPAGRVVWAAVGDPAVLPAPYAGGWIANRAVPGPVTVDARGGIAVPEDALAPEPGTGALRLVGKGKTAHARVTYRLRASAFHDNTRTTAADAAYAYSFAFRWGGRPGGPEYDPAVDAATAALRRALVGFKVLRVDSEVKKYSDITFTYVVPVVEVYLSGAGDAQQAAALAPAWSAVPWPLLVLMEEAVKRGVGAFSQEEAKRRGVPWLDLARDPKVREGLASLVDRFAKDAYVPEPLRRMVAADEAQTRWAALRQFGQRRGHYLVTNGSYRLSTWTGSQVSLEVFRDFSNPMGVGTFDRFALPRRAYVARIAARGDRLEIFPEIERVERFMRDYRVLREPLGAPGADLDAADVPACRYVVVASDGTVAAAGVGCPAQGHRLVLDLKGRVKPGTYTVLIALSLGDNEVDPAVATTQYRVEDAP